MTAGASAALRRRVERPQPAGLHLPDRRHLQRRGRHRPQAGRRHRWPASSPARSPSGTTRRSPRINEGVTLPDLHITAVHRSDDSGTTENFTDYLHKAAPDGLDRGARRRMAARVGGEAATGHLRCGRRGDQRHRHHRLRRRLAGRRPGRGPDQGRRRVRQQPDRRGGGRDRRCLAQGRGPAREHDWPIELDRTAEGALPDRAGVATPSSARSTRTPATADAGQGLPGLHRLRRRPAGRRQGGRDGAAVGRHASAKRRGRGRRRSRDRRPTERCRGARPASTAGARRGLCTGDSEAPCTWRPARRPPLQHRPATGRPSREARRRTRHHPTPRSATGSSRACPPAPAPDPGHPGRWSPPSCSCQGSPP